MKKLLIIILVLMVAAGVLGYWRGWFSVTKEGKVDVAVDSAKFKEDREAFSKTVGEKAKATKDQIAGLWTKSAGLTGDEQARAKKELGALEKKQERLEQQLKELDATGESRFDSLKQDLSKTLEEVEHRIEDLRKKSEQSRDAAK